MFTGALVALATPFRDGGVDWKAARDAVQRQIEGGIDGLVVCGTTGETPTLSADEQRSWVEEAVASARGKVPIVVGTGGYDTRSTLERSRIAESLGADGLLVVTPYYNRPEPTGLRRHFEAIADACSIPVLLYNIPGRTGCNLAAELIAELCAHPRIVGVKDATGSYTHVSELVERGVLVLSGDDASTLPWMALGARGVVSVLANVLPREVVALTRACAAGEHETARELHYRLLPLVRALFLESNPTPLKALLADLGWSTGEVRLPLSEVGEQTLQALRAGWKLATGALPEAARAG